MLLARPSSPTVSCLESDKDVAEPARFCNDRTAVLIPSTSISAVRTPRGIQNVARKPPESIETDGAALLLSKPRRCTCSSKSATTSRTTSSTWVAPTALSLALHHAAGKTVSCQVRGMGSKAGELPWGSRVPAPTAPDPLTCTVSPWCGRQPRKEARAAVARAEYWTKRISKWIPSRSIFVHSTWRTPGWHRDDRDPVR